MNLFVTGIDTDSGKTLVSAILCEALHADYWKPVQAGEPRDAEVVKSLLTNSRSQMHTEQYFLAMAASPHQAARAEGTSIDITTFRSPETNNHLVIEGAGGCLVPLNDEHFMIDLMAHLGARIIVVADLYLGSINHTLLTLEALHRRNLPILGIIFNGPANPESMRIILRHSGAPQLLHITREPVIDRKIVLKYAKALKPLLHE